MRGAFVLTRFSDGGLTLQVPAQECVSALSQGQYWGNPSRGFVAAQIERQIRDGRKPDAAKRFVEALCHGCGTERDALEIIRDRDCAHRGHGIEWLSLDDLPADRWFRDAWSRSHNGGPVGIDLTRAKPIQWQRARLAVANENKRREEAFEPLPLISPPWETLRSAIRHARDHDELRKVWPL